MPRRAGGGAMTITMPCASETTSLWLRCDASWCAENNCRFLFFGGMLILRVCCEAAHATRPRVATVLPDNPSLLHYHKPQPVTSRRTSRTGPLAVLRTEHQGTATFCSAEHLSILRLNRCSSRSILYAAPSVFSMHVESLFPPDKCSIKTRREGDAPPVNPCVEVCTPYLEQ